MGSSANRAQFEALPDFLVAGVEGPNLLVESGDGPVVLVELFQDGFEPVLDCPEPAFGVSVRRYPPRGPSERRDPLVHGVEPAVDVSHDLRRDRSIPSG